MTVNGEPRWRNVKCWLVFCLPFVLGFLYETSVHVPAVIKGIDTSRLSDVLFGMSLMSTIFTMLELLSLVPAYARHPEMPITLCIAVFGSLVLYGMIAFALLTDGLKRQPDRISFFLFTGITFLTVWWSIRVPTTTGGASQPST